MRNLKFRVWDGHTASFFNTPDTHYLPKLKVEDNGIMTIETKDDSYKIMQYTGMNDEKGKDIYEGDILKWTGSRFYKTRNPDVGNVEWNGLTHSVLNDYDNLPYSLNLTPGMGKAFEVIGNIYENPELLIKKP